MSSTPPPPLLPDSVQQAMDAVCWELNNNRNKNTKSGTQNWKLSTTPQQQPKESSLVLLFGFTATRNSNDETEQQQTTASNNPGDMETSSCLSSRYLATFYMAYSTWDGRNLYLDDITLLRHQTQQQQQGEALPNDLIECFHQALARTAVRLGCSRFTWQHYDHQHTTLMCPTIDPRCPPETLERDWWNLHWQADSIRDFLSQTLPPAWLVDKSTTQDEETSVSVQSSVENPTSIIENCLQKLSSQHASLRLSLAKEHNLDAIGRLVQGLADFDKEPDAVHITTDHYRCDGFLCHQPLFYCILINTERKDDRNQQILYPCGMAFCYIGCTLSKGIHLYLEDLFIEEPYRGKGGGTLVMQALAFIASELGCSRMIWQAMEWNTPALTFYDKLGASIQEGLLTSRYAGESLQKCGSLSVTQIGSATEQPQLTNKDLFCLAGPQLTNKDQLCSANDRPRLLVSASLY